MRLSVVELPGNAKQPRRFIGTCMDLTEIRHKDELLRRSHKMDAIGDIAVGLAYDFNQLLEVVLTDAQKLQEYFVDQFEFCHYARQIHQAGARGSKLAAKLSAFAHRDPAESISINLNQFMSAQPNVVSKALTARIKLNTSFEPNLWRVKLHLNGFEDLLLNIAINAMQAIQGRGSLTLCTANVVIDRPKALMLEISAGEYVSLSIADTGCGMSHEVMEKIFEPFYSTKGDDTPGLGLSQVYGFCRAAGGAIEVFSQMGVGSRLVLYFPKEVVKLPD